MTRASAAMVGAVALMAPPIAGAADDLQTLRSEIEMLKKELRELTAAQRRAPPPAPAQAPTPVPAPVPAPAPRAAGLSASVLGATVTLYGTINVDAGTVERTGATVKSTELNSLVGVPGATPASVPSRSILRSNSSNFGIRGKRDFAAGWSAVFQVESSIAGDGGTSTLGGRDTYVGVQSTSYGSLLYGGNIDSPYKRSSQSKDPFYATGIGTQKGILGSPGFNVTSVNGVAGSSVGGNAAGAQQQNAGFDTRLNNLVMYRSPSFAGFSGEIGLGMEEQKTTRGINPKVTSALGKYERGPWFATVAFEEREDVFGLNSMLTLVPGTGVTGALFAAPAGASSKDTASRLTLGYKLFATTEMLLVWERLKYTTSVGTVQEYERDAWVGSVNHRMGKHHAIVSYSKADQGNCSLASGSPCSTRGLGANQWALGYAYDWDPQTWLYLFWTRITNEEAAAYNFGVSGAPAAGVGADPQGLALGIRYRF